MSRSEEQRTGTEDTQDSGLRTQDYSGLGTQDSLVALTGPTAVGKTAAAIDLARRFGGEIVSADSRQLYRGMDIGTAKPTPEERAAAPHHLIDHLWHAQPLQHA